MRHVDAVGAARALSDLQKVHQRLGKAQSAATSGLRHSSAAEDPAWYDTHTRTNASLKRNAQFKDNLDAAQGRLERTDGVLDQATSVVTRLQELSVQMANGTYGAEDRAVAASEVRSLKSEMLALANQRDQDGYIFGGYTSDVAPYDSAGNFVGDATDRTTLAGVGLTVLTSVSGPAAFDFTVFDQLATALDANDQAAVSSGLANVSNALDLVTHARTLAGDRLNVIDSQQTRLIDEDFATTNDRARRVEADPIATYSEIAEATSALQSALKVSASSLQLSLFDML